MAVLTYQRAIKALRNQGTKRPESALERHRREEMARKCRKSLAEFVRAGWHVLEPTTPLIWGWCLDAVCEHLEAVYRGDIKRLLINIPPGHCKSLIACVYFPAWIWIDNPSWRGIFSSYAMGLALRDAVRCRQLMDSDWYQRTFKPKWEFDKEQNAKALYKNTAMGERMAASVGSQITGFRGDAIICDDPHNAMEVLSPVSRAEAKYWWNVAMAERLNSPEKGVKILIGQRLHHDDLFAELIETGEYDHLCLPSEMDPEIKAKTRIGWEDPRKEAGELLFPERVPPEYLEKTKKTLGPDQYSAQHGQRPTVAGGTFFKTGKIVVIHAIPAGAAVRRVRFWDLAHSEGHGDFTRGVRMSMTHDGFFTVEDVRGGQLGPDDRDALILQTAHTDPPGTTIVVEQEGAGGKSVVHAIVRKLAGFSVKAQVASVAKILRADPYASQVRAGNVRMLYDPAWNQGYLSELATFPVGKNDDQVDASSGAFQELTSGQEFFYA